MSNHNTMAVRYSDADLQEFKVLIEGKLAKTKQELDYMRDQITELTESSNAQQGGDLFDDTSVHTDLEMLNNMVIRQQQLFQGLENALLRVQNKTYGICMVTGELIEKKRLLLVPHATKSVAAKEDLPKPVITSTMISSLRETEEEDAPVTKTKVAAEPTRPKLISRVVKKTGGKAVPAKTKAIVDDDDDFEWGDVQEDDLDSSDSEDGEDFNTPILGMNFDEMADDNGE